MESWLDTVTTWANKGVDALIAKKVTQPYELQKMQMQMYGSYGLPLYDANSGNPALAGYPVQGGMNRNLIVVGVGALLLFVALKG